MERRRLTPLQRTRLAFSQQYRCKRCGGLLDPHFHVDHITPLSAGGTNMPANLQALCEDCHIEKTTAERSQSANQTCRRCNTVYSLYFGHTCPPCKAVVR